LTEQQSPVEQALDFLLYAPVGLALTVRDEFPKLVEKGRQQVTGQLALARMAGQFALGQAQREVERLVQQTAERLQELQARGSATPETRSPQPPSANGSLGPHAPQAGKNGTIPAVLGVLPAPDQGEQVAPSRQPVRRQYAPRPHPPPHDRGRSWQTTSTTNSMR